MWSRLSHVDEIFTCNKVQPMTAALTNSNALAIQKNHLLTQEITLAAALESFHKIQHYYKIWLTFLWPAFAHPALSGRVVVPSDVQGPSKVRFIIMAYFSMAIFCTSGSIWYSCCSIRCTGSFNSFSILLKSLYWSCTSLTTMSMVAPVDCCTPLRWRCSDASCTDGEKLQPEATYMYMAKLCQKNQSSKYEVPLYNAFLLQAIMC